MESPEPVDLERETGDRDDSFDVTCTSPCDTWVSATGSYRTAGRGTRPSDRFELLANAGRETVVVSPASSAAFGIGISLIVVGGVVAGIGALGGVADSDGSSGSVLSIDLALSVMAGGLAAEAGGIVLVLLNHSSHVHQITTALGPGAQSSSALSPSDVEHRRAPIPGYSGAPSWPLLRLTF